MLLKEKKKVKLQKHSNTVSTYSLLLAFIAVTLFYSCGTARSADRSATVISQQRLQIVKTARDQIGSKYQYSAKGPKTFDCSGLVTYVYNKESIHISGSASNMYSKGRVIPLQRARPGDLIFYKKGGRIFHVSIISRKEEDKLWVVHSTSSRGVIEEEVLASVYWRPMIYKTVTLSSLK